MAGASEYRNDRCGSGKAAESWCGTAQATPRILILDFHTKRSRTFMVTIRSLKKSLAAKQVVTLSFVRPDGLFALRAHPFGVALRAINFAYGEVVEPACCLSAVRIATEKQ
jgi:hypothetical protein